MSPRLARILGGVRQVVLTAGAVVGVVCILLTVAALALGVRPLVFRSGSMSPTIGTGALAIAHRVDAASLETGQIVSVPTKGGERVTHRIQAVQHTGDNAVLVLKGDANTAVDASPYVVDHADKVLFSVPWLGYVVGWLTGQLGLFLLGLYAAFLLSVLVRPSRGRASDPPNGGPSGGSTGGKRSSGDRSGGTRIAGKRVAGKRVAPKRKGASAGTAPVSALVLVLGLVSGAVLQERTTTTLAAWTDPATVSGTTTTAYTVPAPDGSNCAVFTPGSTSSRGVNLTFAAVTSPAVTYSAAVTGLSGATATVTTSGANKVIQVRYNPGTNANKGVTATVTSTPQLTATASWKGPTTTWKFRTGNNQNTQPICGDAVPAVVAVQAPDGVTRTPAAERAFISGASGCTTDIALCGTIQDASTISSVTYTLKRTQNGTIRYFNGSAWGTNTTPVTVTALTTTYQNQLTFYEDASTATVYPDTGTGSYTLTLTTTDSWNNVTTTVVSFTLS